MIARILGVPVLILSLLLSPPMLRSSSQQEEQTTVLGLYHEWQTEGMPEGVLRVSYDADSQQLVLLLQTQNTALQAQIKAGVTDPENIRFEISPATGTEEHTNNDKRLQGVLALAGAYAACGLALGLFLLARHKGKRKHAAQEKNDLISRMSGFFDMGEGKHGQSKTD